MKEVIKYLCSICGAEYSNENECDECIRGCVDTSEHMETLTIYTCSYCNTEFEYEKECEYCEKDHKQKQDKYYDLFVDKENKERLMDAAGCKTQKRLNLY